MTATATAVLLDPYDWYAAQFIAHIYRDYRVRTVAVHRSWRTRLVMQPRCPVLNSDAVAAHYMLPPGPTVELARLLSRRHDVVAVVPHDEGAVLPLAELACELGLSWAQPDLLESFGCKSALKSRVQRCDPGVRINLHASVADASAVRAWVSEHGISRFVLKPERGSGNRDVAFFDAHASDDDVAAYLDAMTEPVLAEEFVDGDEYWVNGQVDEHGQVTVTGVGCYDRRPANGKPNVAYAGYGIPSDSDVFGALSTYAVQVLTALGLRRSPFHLEAKVDGAGPCLIELGARFGGSLMARSSSWRHGVDLVAVATAGYLPGSITGDRPAARTDWTRADAHLIAQVYGITSYRGMIAEVSGLAEMPREPGFCFWIKRPAVGDRVVPTLDLVQKPWALTLWAPSSDQLRQRVQQAHETVTITPCPEGRRTCGADTATVLRARGTKLWQARPRLEEWRQTVRR